MSIYKRFECILQFLRYASLILRNFPYLFGLPFGLINLQFSKGEYAHLQCAKILPFAILIMYYKFEPHTFVRRAEQRDEIFDLVSNKTVPNKYVSNKLVSLEYCFYLCAVVKT